MLALAAIVPQGHSSITAVTMSFPRANDVMNPRISAELRPDRKVTDMKVDETVTVPADALRAFVTGLFVAADVDSGEAGHVSGSLVESNLCGHESHGVIRVTEYMGYLKTGALKAGVDLKIMSRTASTIVCDAQLGFGQTQVQRLVEIIAPMAADQGVACGTIRRCGHVGRLGEWVERLARRDLAALMMVNDNGVLMCVAPPGGIDARISTNPVAFGVPTAGDPLVLDISTSQVANGKIRVAQSAGRTCPEGWLLDANGQPTTDPSSRFADPPGTILPMGGYKGFGLGLLVDILVGGLSGGFCPPAPPDEQECNNVLLIAFDPARFQGLPHFVTQSQGLCDFVRTSRTIDGSDQIRLPNDRSHETREFRLNSGIPLDHGTWDRLNALAAELGVAVPAPC